MAYATEADLVIAVGGVDRLRELADWDDDGVADAQLISDAIDDAEELINLYIERRLDPVPDAIRRLTAQEAIYNIRVWRETNSQRDDERHDERIRRLEALARNAITARNHPVSGETTSQDAEAGDREAETDSVTRDSLEGLW